MSNSSHAYLGTFNSRAQRKQAKLGSAISLRRLHDLLRQPPRPVAVTTTAQRVTMVREA